MLYCARSVTHTQTGKVTSTDSPKQSTNISSLCVVEEGEDVKAGRDLQEAALGSGEIYKTAQNLGCILLLFKMKANSENNASLNVFECE